MKEEHEILSDEVRDLLRRQTQLLEEQNKVILKLSAKKNLEEEMLLPGEQVLVENLWRDEIRDGFVVTSGRKRLWNIQLNLLVELDRICKKHNIRWFAYGGTLLGAVRHKGFIPWDDDVDVCMLRPDYEKFKQIVKSEVKEPYFVDAWHDYKFEEEEPDIVKDKSFLQVVKRDQRKNCPTWWPLWPMIKLKDSRTTFIQYLDRPHVHQGIWIDIFPFDPVPPFSDNAQASNFEIERELLFAMALPDLFADALKKDGSQISLSIEDLKYLLKLKHRERAKIFDAFCLESFSSPEFVGQVRNYCLVNRDRPHPIKNFEQTIYLPFEKMEILAPIDFKDSLKRDFGDWHKPVFYPSHAKIYSANFSYKEFFERVKFII